MRENAEKMQTRKTPNTDTFYAVLWSVLRKESLRKIPYFHLIFWCGNFVKRHKFRIVLGKLSGTMRKLCLSTKYPHQNIRLNLEIDLTIALSPD